MPDFGQKWKNMRGFYYTRAKRRLKHELSRFIPYGIAGTLLTLYLSKTHFNSTPHSDRDLQDAKDSIDSQYRDQLNQKNSTISNQSGIITNQSATISQYESDMNALNSSIAYLQNELGGSDGLGGANGTIADLQELLENQNITISDYENTIRNLTVNQALLDQMLINKNTTIANFTSMLANSNMTIDQLQENMSIEFDGTTYTLPELRNYAISLTHVLENVSANNSIYLNTIEDLEDSWNNTLKDWDSENGTNAEAWYSFEQRALDMFEQILSTENFSALQSQLEGKNITERQAILQPYFNETSDEHNNLKARYSVLLSDFNDIKEIAVEGYGNLSIFQVRDLYKQTSLKNIALQQSWAQANDTWQAMMNDALGYSDMLMQEWNNFEGNSINMLKIILDNSSYEQMIEELDGEDNLTARRSIIGNYMNQAKGIYDDTLQNMRFQENFLGLYTADAIIDNFEAGYSLDLKLGELQNIGFFAREYQKSNLDIDNVFTGNASSVIDYINTLDENATLKLVDTTSEKMIISVDNQGELGTIILDKEQSKIVENNILGLEG